MPGAIYSGDDAARFTVWAPLRSRVDLRVLAPGERTIAMDRGENGYWTATVAGVKPGTRYLYRLDNGRERPDPASRFQPDGVHGPSEVVDHAAFRWTDAGWKGLPLADYVLYEFHVGAFTPEGTFDAVRGRLDDLKELGITAIELMPVAQFPGARNWGYDGVHPFAVQNSYGGPDGLKRLVDACHARGLAVVLDVVYNHLGPEGNYLAEFGPYFTDRYRTPWGQAVNFDGPLCDEVRRYFIANAIAWVTDYHIDALRIDAIHGIFDLGARHILRDLGEAVHGAGEEAGRQVFVIPESDLNDTRVISPREVGGYGLDAQWNDDFHHCVHTLLTGEQAGYYQDFGRLEDLAAAWKEGFVYGGRYSPYRRRSHGNSSKDRPAHQFVVFSQNHDQVGNRMRGERLAQLVPFEALKLAAACILLSPYIPLLFMGEEYAETAPFLYFVSHSDRDLIEAVRKGRREEFRAFGWEEEPPDPQDEATFARSRLHWELRGSGQHRTLLAFHRNLLAIRRALPALAHLSKERQEVRVLADVKTLLVARSSTDGGNRVLCAFVFRPDDVMMRPDLPPGGWRKVLDSSETEWGGPGTFLPDRIVDGDEVVFRGLSAAVYARKDA